MAVITSPSSTASTVTLALGLGWWLVDPLNPALTISLNVVGFPTSTFEQLTAHYPLGVKYPTVVADVVNGTDGQLEVETTTAAEWNVLKTTLSDQRIKYLMSPFGDGLYIRVGAASPTMGISGQVKQTQLSPGSPNDAPFRQLTIQYVEMAMP